MNSTKELRNRFFACFHPPERISKSQWAEKHRRLSAEASSQKGGKFTFDMAPWQREPMDAPDDPEVGKVVMMWASQATGKTETLLCMLAHWMDVDPCPILILLPSLELAETWSTDRIAPMLRDNSRLTGLVRDPRSRDSGNKILSKRFRGGAVTLAGANSPASLSSRPIRVVVFDEVDSFPDSAGTEGDPCALAEKRQESFPDAVIVEVSTPKKPKGFSRIEKDFEDSDKRFWFVDCPHCGVSQTLKWAQVKWENDDPKTAWYECSNDKCAHRFDDAGRREMVLKGRWVATAPFKGVRGYHLNGIYCLFRAKKPFKNRLEQFVADFQKANAGGSQKVKVWENTFLAETVEIKGERIDYEPLLHRQEPYTGVPAPVLVLTCAVDVQGDRLEAEIKGHGRHEETWGIAFKQFFGNPQQQAVWETFDQWVSGEFTRADGAKLKVSIVCIDTGDGKTQKAAYQFIKPRQSRKFFACKGSSVSNAALVRRSQPNKKNPHSQRVHLFIIGTDSAKATIFSRIQLTDHGPRYQHFPVGNGYDEEFFKQLTAEEMRTEFHRGFPHRVWVKVRPRNEALDLAVLHLAAYEILNPRLDQIEKDLAASVPRGGQNPVQESNPPREYVLKPTQTDEAPVVRDLRRNSGINRATGQRRGGWVKGWN